MREADALGNAARRTSRRHLVGCESGKDPGTVVLSSRTRLGPIEGIDSGARLGERHCDAIKIIIDGRKRINARLELIAGAAILASVTGGSASAENASCGDRYRDQERP